MEKGIVAFSFDDGRLDNYVYAYPILKKYHLPATFNITTGYIEGKINREEFDFPEPMTIQMVQEIFQNDMYEIAGHGNMHINTLEDIVNGIQGLHKLIGTKSLKNGGNGFASPGSDLTEDMYREMKPELDHHQLKYVRVSCRYKSLRRLKVIFRKLSRILKWPWIYRFAYQDTLMNVANNGILYSIPVLSSVTPKQIKSIVRKTSEKKQGCILMMHSIVPKESIRNTWDYPCERFDEICKIVYDYQKMGLLDVKTTMDLYNSITR